MTDWMLYEEAKTWNEDQLQHRIDWLNKQGNSWLAEFIEATNQKEALDSRLFVAENQVKCYARQSQELTELSHQFGKLLKVKGGDSVITGELPYFSLKLDRGDTPDL